MTLTEIVKEFGQVPKNARLHDGTMLEMMVRKRTNNKGYIATIWTVLNDRYDTMIEHGEGDTEIEAKEDLKNKILANE